MNLNRFDEVVFLDDFFRSGDNGLGYTSQRPNRWFLREFFGGALTRLGVRIREESAQSDGGNIRVSEFMNQLGLEPSVDGWAAACSADLDDHLHGVRQLALGSRSLVVGWGLPPSLLRYIDHCGASFLDVEVDPLRFGRHLYLHARSNDERIRRTLEGLHVSREVFWDAATHVKSYFARRGEQVLYNSSAKVGLFAGQTEVDLALIQDGRLVAPMDFFDTLSDWAREVDVLLVKQHPHAQESKHVEDLLQQIPNAVPTELNVYSIFWAKNLRFVAALSSGVLKEAEFFGLESRSLLLPDRNNPAKLPASTSSWFTVTAEVAGLQSMKEMTQGGAELWGSIQRRMRGKPAESPDTLDLMFGERWGLDMNASGLPQVPLLKVDQTYVFGETPGLSNWIGSGWHQPESWGVWSTAGPCLLVLPLHPSGWPSAGNLRLNFCLQTLPGVSEPATVTKIQINGHDYVPRLEKNDDRLDVSIELSQESCQSCPVLLVTLHVSGAQSPFDAVGQPDRRILGVAFISLTVASGNP